MGLSVSVERRPQPAEKTVPADEEKAAQEAVTPTTDEASETVDDAETTPERDGTAHELLSSSFIATTQKKILYSVPV